MPSSEVMDKYAHDDLHSGGPNGPKVKSRAQAIAIMESEKRKEDANGGHYPEGHKKRGGPHRRPTTRLAQMR